MKELEKICFHCSNAHVDEENKLHCILKNGIIVQDEESCEEYN